MGELRYFDLLKRTDNHTLLFFFMHALFKARMETDERLYAREEGEAIATYLGHTMVSIARGQWPWHLATVHAIDLWSEVNACRSSRQKCRLLRTNGEARLLSRLFDAVHGTGGQSGFSRLLSISEATAGLGQQCFSFAAVYAERLPEGSQIAPVYQQVAQQYPIYLKVIGHVAASYLSVRQSLNSTDLYQLEVSGEVEVMKDRFLEAYSAWLDSAATEPSAEVVEAARNWRQVDHAVKLPPEVERLLT